MKQLLLICLIVTGISTSAQTKNAEKIEIEKVLDAWHKAAADAKFDAYFSYFTKDAVFVGTDATEHWDFEAFKSYSKPHFDEGKAWSFTPIQRHLYTSDDGNLAWFDELLDTQMKICRGSGVLKKQNGKWKIAQYVLSIAIPNDKVDDVTKIKADFDTKLTKELQSK